jgi:hypothetical protein
MRRPRLHTGGMAAVALLRGRYPHLRSVNLAASVPYVLRPVSISR